MYRLEFRFTTKKLIQQSLKLGPTFGSKLRGSKFRTRSDICGTTVAIIGEMSDLMNSESSILTETFTTLITLERLFFHVNVPDGDKIVG